jgi:hypothetical protein
MSLWELTALVDGFNAAHGGEDGDVAPMTVERLKEINPPRTIH